MNLAQLAQRLRSKPSLYTILTVNVLGIAYGFYYYVPQFADTPVWLWPLVPDSPFAVLLMTLALGFVAVDRSKPWLNLLGSAAMLKVGVWTAVVLAWFPQHFNFAYLPDLGCSQGIVFGCGNLNTYLFYLHLAMALEPLIVADLLPVQLVPFGAVGGLLVVHDVIDYTWPVDYLNRGCEGIFPHTLPCTNVAGVFLVTVGLTVASMLALMWLSNTTIAGRS